MGRLDQLDLSLKLSHNKEAGRLAAGQQRLLQLRLHLGGLIGDGRLGPPVCVLFEGWDAGEEWSRAYGQIARFEESLAAEGTLLVKFWLHLSGAEQLRRFKRREKDPLKTWKITDEVWRNRKKRPAYLAAVEEMVERTDKPYAPWTLVEGESKRWARIAAG